MAKKEEEIGLYKLDRDLEQVLHNIVNDFKNKKSSIGGMGPKQQYFYNIRVQGPFMELRVESLKGGWRTSRMDQIEQQQFAAECAKELSAFEKVVREEFKERTGKSLRWGRGKEHSNYEAVALNGLYKFYSYKSGPVRVKIERQQFTDNKKAPKLNKPAVSEEDALAIYQDLELPERWK